MSYVGLNYNLKDPKDLNHGLSAEQFPVSTYVGSSRDLKDLKAGPCARLLPLAVLAWIVANAVCVAPTPPIGLIMTPKHTARLFPPKVKR